MSVTIRPMRATFLAVIVVLGACAPAAAPRSASGPTVEAAPSTEATAASSTPAGQAPRSPAATPAQSSPPAPTPGQRAAGLAAIVAERSGDDLEVTISGLMPDERVELIVTLARSGFTSPMAADGLGEARVRVPLRGDAPIEVVVRRGSGPELRAAFAPVPAVPTGPGLAASAAPASIAPSVAAPSATPAPRAGAPFAVALEPAEPPPGSTPEIVVTGLLAGEAFDLGIAVTGGGTDTYGVQADAAGSLRWRSPVVPGIGFRVTAVRRSGEHVTTSLAAATTATPAPTEPPCVTTGTASASTGVEGYVVWAGRPLGGLTVEVRQTPAQLVLGWCFDCRLLGSGVTDAAGHYRVTGIPPGIRVEVAIPDARYTGDGPDGRTVRRADTCAGRVVPLYAPDGPLELYWDIKGFETGAAEADGDRTLRWGPVPGATSYCVRMLDQGPPPFTPGIALTNGSCLGRADHTTLTNPTFRTPPLIAGDRKYDVRIIAFTGTSAAGVFFGGFRKFE